MQLLVLRAFFCNALALYEILDTIKDSAARSNPQ